MLKRRITSLFLAAAMLVTMLPVSALTAHAEEAAPEETAVTAEEALPEETAAAEEEPVLTEAADRIKYVNMIGLHEPIAGEHPMYYGYQQTMDHYSTCGHLQWSCLDTGEFLTSDDVFELGKVYQLEVAFVPDAGYLFDYGTSITAAFNGSTAGFEATAWNVGEYTGPDGAAGLMVSYTFSRLNAIHHVQLEFLRYPYVGDVGGENLNIDGVLGCHFTTGKVTWRDYTPGEGGRALGATETFLPGHTYRLEVYLIPDTGYYFAVPADMTVDVDYISAERYTCKIYNDSQIASRRVLYLGFEMPDAFSDVTTESDFWYRPVYWGAAEGITTGWDDGTFRPWNNCNRAQIITFLWRLAGSPLNHANDKPVFSDVDGTLPNDFYPAIMWGYAEGIIKGYSDGTFRPWVECNRMQIATFLYRYARLQNGGLDVISDAAYAANVGRFSDLPSGDEFRRAVVWAVWFGVTTGYSDGTFRPMNICNRAQAMTFLQRWATMPAG